MTMTTQNDSTDTQETYIILYCTAETRAQALEISHSLVAEKLAACTNILGSVTSVFEWRGEMNEVEEISFIIKTTERKRKAAIQRIVELHSYDCPCVLALRVDGGHGEFLSWISQSIAE